MTRKEWPAMTDEELLAFYRKRYPYISLGSAKELRHGELKL
jgi:hypothetical protein